MKTYGYVRISSKDQNTNRQVDAFKERGIASEFIFVDMISGKNFERPEYRRLLKRARRGDLIVIKSIDRLGRNYKEILEQWRMITMDRGIDIEVLYKQIKWEPASTDSLSFCKKMTSILL